MDEYLTELQSNDLSEFFFLKEIVTLNVTAAVNHFNTQSRGSDGSSMLCSCSPSFNNHLPPDLFNASIKYSMFSSE